MLSTSKAFFRKAGGGAGPTTDATFAYVPLLLETGSASSLNTTVTDSSASPNTVTRTANPSTGWVSPYQTDGYWGNQFNGTNAYLSVARQSSFLLGTNNFTIEFWVYFNSVASAQTVAGSHVTTAAGDWAIYTASTGSLNYYLSSTGATWNIANQVSIGSISVGTWYHVALVRNGSVFTPYLNGVAGTTTTSSASLFASSAPVSIAASNNPSTYFSGYVSNFRMVNGTAIVPPAGGPTSPLTAVTNTVLLTCQSNRFIDNSTANSGVGFPITVNGTPQVTPYFYPSGFTAPAASPGAGLFNGTSQYLSSTTGTTVFQFGSNPYTIEGWVYQATRPARQWLCGGVFSGASYQVAINASGFIFGSVSGIGDLTAATIAVPLNAWTHFAVVRTSTSSGGVAYYINGAAAGTATDSSNISGTTTTLNVGTTNNDGSIGINGYIGNFRVVKGTAVYTGAFTPPSGPLTQNSGTYPSLTNVVTGFTAANTTLLLNLADSNYNSATNGVQNNTFIDSSNYAFPVTRNGTATQGSYTPYWPNGQWSNYFAGSQSISAPASSSFQFAGDFTIECWVFRTTTGDQTTYIQTNSTTYFALNVNAGTGLNIYLNSATASIAATDRVPALNVWNHVALVRSGSGSGNVKVYLNGVVSATTTTNTSTLGYNLVAYVGSIGTQSSGSNVGYISNVRVVAAAVYTSNFTPPTAPLGVTSGGQNPPTGTQTKLLTCQSNRFIDNSSTPATITVNGAPLVQAFQPFSPTASYTTALYGGSGYFNGSTDYLSITDGADLKLGSGNFTIEGWVYCPAVSGNNSIYSRNLFGMIIGISSSNFTFFASSNGSSWNLASGITFGAATSNTWAHFAAVRNGANITLYLNGVLGNTVAVSTNALYEVTAPTVGFWTSGGANWYLNGYVSNLRVVKGTAVYTGAFTPPTLAPLATTGPTSAASYSSTTNVNTTFLTPASLLLNMTNAGIYDAAAQNVITTVGDAQVSTAQYKWPPTSIRFDGTGDYLSVSAGSPQSLTFGTGDFTIEFWVYFTSNTGQQCLYDGRAAAGAYPLLYTNAGVITYYVGGAPAITSIQPSTGVWYFMSLIRSSGTTRFFINGTQSGGSYSDSTNYLAPPTSGARVGANYTGGDFLFGYIEDFRVTKGVARAATPIPTAAFPTR